LASRWASRPGVIAFRIGNVPGRDARRKLLQRTGGRAILVRRRSRRGSRKYRNLIVWVALGLLILGFLTRRIFAPAAMRHIAAPPPPTIDGSAINKPQRSASDPRGNEQLSDQDRRTLDAIVRGKNR
jgi:hypothetical protein